MYEIIILTLLIRRPAHGYLIASIINDMIGPYAKISNGRLYPLLSKLQQEDLIVENDETIQTHKGERHVRSYKITEEGRKRFHQLMMDTTSNPGEYQRIFWQKVPVLRFLQPTERTHLLDHYINYCQAHVLHMHAEADDYAQHAPNWAEPSEINPTLCVIHHTINHWQLELEWAKSLCEKETFTQKEGN